MNYLAHAYLSFGEPQILTGNLISDFVKGKKKYDYPPRILGGINLHRLIDDFTDTHPVNKKTATIFKPAYGLYSSAFLDVVYDHFLARELSEEDETRWLTLIAPPSSLTQAWLRDAGLNRERILLLQPRGNQSPLQLACEALRLGRSHTVVSWLGNVNATARQQLLRAASAGNAQSLNIRLG